MFIVPSMLHALFLLTRPYGRDQRWISLSYTEMGFYSHAHTGVINGPAEIQIDMTVSTHTPIRA